MLVSGTDLAHASYCFPRQQVHAAPKGPLDMVPLLKTVGKKEFRCMDTSFYYAYWPQGQRVVMSTVYLTIKLYAIISSVIYLKRLRGLFLKHGFLCIRSSQWRENTWWLKQRGKNWNLFKNKVINLFTLALSERSLSALCVGHSIKELYVKLNLIINGKTVLTYSETLCEPGLSKLIFCGKKKGGNLGSTLSVWWLLNTPSRMHPLCCWMHQYIVMFCLLQQHVNGWQKHSGTDTLISEPAFSPNLFACFSFNHRTLHTHGIKNNCP